MKLKSKGGVSLLLMVMLVLSAVILIGCSEDAQEENDAQEESPVEADSEENDDSTEAGSELTPEEVYGLLYDEDYVFVDTRINDAYNGWALDGVVRGGHLPGAVDFSARWLTLEEPLDEDTILELLEERGITEEKQVVLYDVTGEDREAVKEVLTGLGFENLLLFDLNPWAEDEEYPLVQHPNYQLIVPAVVVKAVIDGETPETFENAKNIKVVEASWGEEETSYANGHVPGTFHINTDAVEPPPEWMLADDETLTEFALSHGFTAEDTVIVTSEDYLAAFRVAVVLQYIGVEDVRVLNGGLQAWVAEGFELETDRHDPVPVEDFGAAIPGRPELIVTIPELKDRLENDDSFTLVDNRTWEEHIGETSGYSYHDKEGRIPGSVFGYAGFENAYSMEYYRNPDQTMRNPEILKGLWEGRGIDLEKHLSFMCGSGWRAAEVLYYAHVMGLENTSLYSDGWIGWSMEGDRPFETGQPE